MFRTLDDLKGKGSTNTFTNSLLDEEEKKNSQSYAGGEKRYLE